MEIENELSFISLINPVQIALLNDSILYAITKESESEYMINELLKTNKSLNSYIYNYASKFESSINDILLTEFYTIIIGENEN